MIQSVDNDDIALSFDNANIVKDTSVENFYEVYGPKETYFDVFDNLSHFCKGICRVLPAAW